MRFKEFLQKEELQGLYGNPVKVNPARVDHALDKKFWTGVADTPSTKKRGGSDIKRMMGGQKTMAKASMPSANLPQQVTLRRNNPGEFFKPPKKSSTPTKVKSPLGISSS
jgi:hypothetical protein